MFNKKATRKYLARRNELKNELKNGVLSVNDAELSLAGFLLKQYDSGERSQPVLTHGQTLHDNCLYNAKTDLAMGLE